METNVVTCCVRLHGPLGNLCERRRGRYKTIDLILEYNDFTWECNQLATIPSSSLENRPWQLQFCSFIENNNNNNNNNNKIYFHLVCLVTFTIMTGNLNGGWTPEITLRANLVGCPLYWKLNVKYWAIFHSTNERSHWIKENISDSNLNNSILLKSVSCCYCYCSATNGIFHSENRALLKRYVIVILSAHTPYHPPHSPPPPHTHTHTKSKT